MSAGKKIGNYQLDLSQKLGKGAYGEVYLGKDIATNEVIAVKQISIFNLPRQEVERAMQLTKNEVSIMLKLKHPNLVQLYSYQLTQNNIYLMMEYCDGGTLDQYIRKKCQKQGKLNYLAETEARLIMNQIIQGYKEMYNQKIIHRDLKPANILINKDIVKISDFGFSKVLMYSPEASILKTYAGSPLYMAPQILNQQQYSTKADIWSLGIIFYEVLYGQTPWQVSTLQELMMKISLKSIKFPLVPKVSEGMKILITKMLQVDEKDRIGWEELFHQQFLQEQQFSKQIQNSIIKIQNVEDKLLKSNLKKNLYIHGAVQNIKHAEEEQKKIEQACPNIIQRERSRSPISRKKEGIFEEKKPSLSPRQQMLIDEHKSITSKEAEDDIKLRPLLKEINDWIVHKRNKSQFINTVSQHLFDQWTDKKLLYDQSIYYGMVFILTKYQVIILYKIYIRLQKKTIENTTKKFTQNQWTQFCKSKDYFPSLKFILNDYTIIRNFMLDLIPITQQYLKKSTIEEMINIFQICNDQQVDKKTFNQIFQSAIDYFKVIVSSLIPSNKERAFLVFAQYLFDCSKIHTMFKFKQMDYFKYYDEIENYTDDYLLDQLLQK